MLHSPTACPADLRMLQSGIPEGFKVRFLKEYDVDFIVLHTRSGLPLLNIYADDLDSRLWNADLWFAAPWYLRRWRSELGSRVVSASMSEVIDWLEASGLPDHVLRLSAIVERLPHQERTTVVKDILNDYLLNEDRLGPVLDS